MRTADGPAAAPAPEASGEDGSDDETPFLAGPSGSRYAARAKRLWLSGQNQFGTGAES